VAFARFQRIVAPIHQRVPPARGLDLAERPLRAMTPDEADDAAHVLDVVRRERGALLFEDDENAFAGFSPYAFAIAGILTDGFGFFGGEPGREFLRREVHQREERVLDLVIAGLGHDRSSRLLRRTRLSGFQRPTRVQEKTRGA